MVVELQQVQEVVPAEVTVVVTVMMDLMAHLSKVMIMVVVVVVLLVVFGGGGESF